jgi:pyrimidine operon attenuation protein/uracil phosphoribosyltransferase
MSAIAPDRFRAYEGAALAAVMERMARQTARLLDGTPTTLVGMLRRGAPLAERLHARLRELVPSTDLALVDLQVKRYADNLELLHPDTQLVAPAAVALGGRRVIVVDDVLYQGYSLFRVFEWLRTQAPAAIHAAVLVDRCCAVLPVDADVVGLRLEIAPHDVIECNVPPYETTFAIDIWRPDQTTARS